MLTPMADRQTPTSCIVCRQRKVKCDQKLPCSSCVRHKAPDMCLYTRPATPRPVVPSTGTIPEPPSGAKRIREGVDAAEDGYLASGVKRLPLSSSPGPLSQVFLGPSANITALSRFQSIREVVAVNPVLEAGEEITLMSKISPLAFDPVTLEEVNHGVLSWHMLVRSDPGLAQIWNFLYDFSPSRTTAGYALVHVPNVYLKGVQRDQSKFQFLDHIRRYQALEIDHHSREAVPQIPLGLTFNDPNPGNLHIDISEELLKILPAAHVAECLIQRFFRTLYPFFPFLDEEKFRADAARVLGLEQLARTESEATADGPKLCKPQSLGEYLEPRTSASVRSASAGGFPRKLQISAPSDLATVGLFCIVLRMSYLSMLSNVGGEPEGENPGTGGNQQHQPPAYTSKSVFPALGVDGVVLHRTTEKVIIENDQDLLEVPIGIEMIDLAQRCLDHYQKQHRYNLSVVQLLAYMRIYQELSPENADGPSRDVYQLNNAVLVQTAQMIGLHRAPFGSQAALRSRLWCFIQFKDVSDAFKFGSNFHCDIPSDCKLAPDGRDIALVAMEPVQDLTKKMQAVVRCLVQLERIQAGVLIARVNELERCLYSMGTLAEFRADDLVSCVRVQYHVPVHVGLMTLYFRLFGHYEASQHYELAYFYCKKIVCMITQTLLPRLGDILLARHDHFGYALQMVVNSVLENFMQRSVGFVSAWMVRLGNRVMAGQDQQYRLRACMQSLHRCYMFSLFGILKMNHRYCYAWRVGIIYAYILSCISLQDFYQRSLAPRRLSAGGTKPDHVPRAGFELPPDSIISSCEMVFSDQQVDDLVHEISRVSTEVPCQYAYWHLVSGVVKFGDINSRRLYDPSKSPLVFEVPHRNGFQDLDLDWFPESAVNFNQIMESFYDAGPMDPMSILDLGVYD